MFKKSQTIADFDDELFQAMEDERQRQEEHIELIASENIVSRAVLDALAHPITNKTLEGYPGFRFHGGGEFVDIIEQAGARPAGVCVALDRLERGLNNENTATRLIEKRHGIPVLSIADLDVLVDFLAGSTQHQMYLEAIENYRRRYGIT